MSKQQQLLLCEFFEEISQAEASQDKIKQQLASNKYFDLSKMFHSISQNKKSITPKLLHSYLLSKLRVTQNQCYTIFSKFDHEQEGQISLSEFSKQLSPLSKTKSLQKQNTDPVLLFLKLVQQYIDKERLFNICRKDLNLIVKYEMFDIIATQRKGYISRRQLQVFLERNNVKASNKFVDCLMFGLKRRSYFKITLEAFCENLDPLEFGFYPKYAKSIQQEEKQQAMKRNQDQRKRAQQIRDHQQKIANEARKQRRKQEAENEKQRAIEEELKREAEKARQQSEKLLKKAALQAEKLERLQLEKQKLILEDQIWQNEMQKIKLKELRTSREIEMSEAVHLDRRILNNEMQLQSDRRLIRHEQESLLHLERINNAERQNIQVGLRRDRCLSDIYSAQKNSYLDREAQLERIRRQTALALLERQHHSPFLSLDRPIDRPIDRVHIYRPQSTYSPYINMTPASLSYGNSLNSTSKMKNQTHEKHHSLMKETYSPIRHIDEKSKYEKFKTPSEARNYQLERSRQDLESKIKKVEDEIRTGTGRKHPYA